MTKQELIAEMSRELSLTKKKTSETLNAMIEEISSVLESGGKFVQLGFGTFKTSESKEREGINPATKKRMLYPKKIRLKFKPSRNLKDEINEDKTSE